MSVREGESVIVECHTTGEQFDLRWSKERSRERVNTVVSIFYENVYFHVTVNYLQIILFQNISGGLALKLERVGAGDTGTYRCMGRDRNGSPKYEDFSLTVLTGINFNCFK